MKKLLLFITAIFICGAAIAQTIRWHIGDTVYQTTTCNAGESITPPTAPDRFGYTFQEWAEYIPIEYLESTGTQYIDTGFMFTDNSGQVDLEYEQTRATGNFRLFGYWVSASSNSLTLRLDNSYYLTWTGSTEIFKGDEVYSSANIKHKVVNIFNNGTYTITFDNQTYEGSYTRSISENGQVCYLFAMKYSGAYGIAYAKIYSAKIYDNNILVRDFIPVLDGNGTPCMYDKVEKKFYYNAGTGQFIAGPVVGE